MRRAALLIRLLQCFDEERDQWRRTRLALVIIKLERGLYRVSKAV